MTPDEVIERIESLPVHSISGYEWECAECEYDWEAGHYQDSRGNESDHGRMVDRDLLVRLFKEAA